MHGVKLPLHDYSFPAIQPSQPIFPPIIHSCGDRLRIAEMSCPTQAKYYTHLSFNTECIHHQHHCIVVADTHVVPRNGQVAKLRYVLGVKVHQPMVLSQCQPD